MFCLIQDGGNANLALAQSATLTQSGTLQSLSFYVTTGPEIDSWDCTEQTLQGRQASFWRTPKAFVAVVG